MAFGTNQATEVANADLDITIGEPTAADGIAVHQLVARCPPLDRNSLYCDVRHCAHFSSTSALARLSGEVSGFISAYLLPDDPGVLFIWQVAVDEAARGIGLARRMIANIVARPVCASVHSIHTTVTAGNTSSRGMFAAAARELGAVLEICEGFDRQRHLGDRADSEDLIVIAPIALTKP